ncbi:DUF1631 family protein [Oxalobacteraceae bacterium R-40]|uniref:DUF1631 family protein n=1 Tax=Keguizhuia sedimenti TaxID=3064264 RepID=A0ABU1BRS5_9BURK|nr:DUF1631 family protein [Oxalobacteraceae bacterium R-40]
MVSLPFKNTASGKKLTASSRNALFQNLVSLVTVLCAEKIDDFSERLAQALLHLSEQSVKPTEAELSFNGFNYLRKNFSAFQKNFVQELDELLAREIRLIEQNKIGMQQHDNSDLSLVTFEEMENKVLLGNVAQSLELALGDTLSALNLRIGWILGREETTTAENPFRPQVFVEAIYQAWRKIDPAPESHRVMLHQLGPELFLPLNAIFGQLNEALVERSILPDLTEAYRKKKAENKVGLPPPKVEKRDQSKYNKVRDWLLSAGKKKSGGDAAADDLNVPDLFSLTEGGGNWNANTISVKVGPRMFVYLNNLQSQIDRMEMDGQLDPVPQSAATLRKVKEQAPPGMLTAVDENTIELLANILDFVFQEKSIPSEIKKLMGQLQIPLLKAALLDKKFFVKDDHPARRLVDTLAKCSLALDRQKGYDDPLYKMIEQIVGRVQKEFDQQMSLFDDAVSGIESLLDTGDKQSQDFLATPIAEALRQEKIGKAKEAAENDIAARLETGEVASFVEAFLETQWVRILTLAHSSKDKKPDVLAKALRTMDDLIWSVKPKASPEQRKELISRLPSILAMLNAWLNAIKWHEPERVTFFSTLAERHAAIVRMQPEASSRHQVEIAVNIAEKASSRRMRRQAAESRGKIQDEFLQMVNGLDEGSWLEFSRNNGGVARLKLAWISPQRTRFIFTNRQGEEPSLFTVEELAKSLRDRSASLVQVDSIVERALNVVLDPEQ